MEEITVDATLLDGKSVGLFIINSVCGSALEAHLNGVIYTAIPIDSDLIPDYMMVFSSTSERSRKYIGSISSPDELEEFILRAEMDKCN